MRRFDIPRMLYNLSTECGELSKKLTFTLCFVCKFVNLWSIAISREPRNLVVQSTF